MSTGRCSNDPVLFDRNSSSITALFELFRDMAHQYNLIHPWVCAVMCPVGMLLNFLHLLVLTRPRMARSPVNRILVWVAVCDVLTMSSYFLYILRFVIVRRWTGEMGFNYNWASFLRLHATLSICLHSSALYLSVTMAFVRWKAMRTPHSVWLKPNVSGYVCLGILIVVSLICLPTYLVHDVTTVMIEGQEKYTVDFSQFAVVNDCRFLKWNLWLIGILLKVVPCILLCFFTTFLMILLKKNNDKRIQLLYNNNKKRQQNFDRTTLTLIVMLTTFVFTELPQGVISVLNGIYTNDVYEIIYRDFGNLLDLLSLINCYVGFIAYCFLCSKYRQTFLMMLIRTSEKASQLETTFGERFSGLYPSMGRKLKVVEENSLSAMEGASLQSTRGVR